MIPVDFKHLLLFSSIAVGLVVCASHWDIQNGNQQNPVPRFRLPTTLLPTHYQLGLIVVLDPLPGYPRFTATGNVTINTSCQESTDEIFLHAVNLTISHESVRVVSGSTGLELGVRSLTYELENDFFIISLDAPLESGEAYDIHIRFVAPIPDYRLNGMYQDYYEDPETGETRYMATTLFAPYHARRLFPSFDEPSFRAKYSVQIAHHAKYHAMANEEIISSRPVEGLPEYVWDVFSPTPSISSYIAAMIVSDFTYEQAPPTDFPNRTVRVYASPHLIAKGAGAYAANITDAVMGFFENRFLIDYPLGKLYSIALPHFFFNAMENIGMITYKEPVLLYLKNETTEEERYKINYVMSHELAHQWFGNIVACKWWAYVWLKEGFATFYSHYGMNHTNPELNPWEMFVPNILNVAMEFDAGNESHPMENFPPTSAAVADIYTAIPYQKGASILRMTSTFLTEAVFELGIKQYVNKYQYISAEQNDLFDCLQEELDKSSLISAYIPATVREIMNSWTQQARFPVIYVSRNESTSQLQLTQEEFSEEGPGNSTTWWVPINLQPRSKPDLPGTVPDAWIPQGVSSIAIDVTPGETVVVNPDGTGYYKVQYDQSLHSDIVKQLGTHHSTIPASGRSKLIDDYFQLAFSGHVPLETALELTTYLSSEMSAAVWQTFHNQISKLLKLLNQIDDEQTSELLKVYVTSKIRPALKELYSIYPEGQSGSTGILFEMLNKLSCDMGLCYPLVEEQIKTFVAHPNTSEIPKEFQFVAYCSAVSQDSSTFEVILREYLNPNTLFGRKQRLLNALSCTTDHTHLNWLVKSAFGEDMQYFSIHDKLELLKVLVKKPLAAELVLDRMDENLDIFFERFGEHAEQILTDTFTNTNSDLTDAKITRLTRRYSSLQPFKAKRVEMTLIRSKRRQGLLKKSHLKLRQWLERNAM